MILPSDPLLEPDEAEHQPALPDHTMTDEEVEALEVDYSDRHPTDWVASGPLGEEGKGRGRWHPSWDAAERWARKFYGARLKRRIPEAGLSNSNRWAFLIRKETNVRSDTTNGTVGPGQHPE